MANTTPPRLMTRGDIPFADAVRALAGWNQTPRDWERFLLHEPGGCFVAEGDEGQPAGTATTIRYGTALAWIGMVLVHPDFRRQGHGQRLLIHCLEHLKSQGVTCIKLDATPMGRPLYAALGFQEEWELTRWSRDADAGRGVSRISAPDGALVWSAGLEIRPLSEGDWPGLVALDTAAFGPSREAVLRELARQGSLGLVAETSRSPGAEKGGAGGGEGDGYGFAGFGMLRAGSRAWYLGPLVAPRPEDAGRLAAALLAHADGQPVYWDIPDAQSATVEQARAWGFSPQRSLTRMFYGSNGAPGKVEWVHGIVAPEMG